MLYPPAPQNSYTSITATYLMRDLSFGDEGGFACYADNDDFISRDSFDLTVYGKLSPLQVINIVIPVWSGL